MDDENESTVTTTLPTGRSSNRLAAGGKRRGDPDNERYSGGASKEQVEALWAEFGKDRVKAVPGYQKLTIGELRGLLK